MQFICILFKRSFVRYFGFDWVGSRLGSVWHCALDDLCG